MEEVDVGIAEGLAGVVFTAETNGGNGPHCAEHLDKVGLCDLWVQVSHVQRGILQKKARWLWLWLWL